MLLLMLIRIWASIAKQGGGSSDTLPLGPMQCLPVVSRGKGTQREAVPRLGDTKVIYLFFSCQRNIVCPIFVPINGINFKVLGELVM